MASEFTYINPEAAKQAIARLQLQAALAENQSREAIAREQTQAQRYATQSQISEREKDRQVSRDDIASRERYRTGAGTDAATRDRANVQYQTVLAEISETDPMTKRELEARIAAFPQITEDLANNLRSTRDQAYKNAKANFAMGDRMAKNYQTELDAFAKTPNALGAADVYKRLNADRNVVFDRASGSVSSAFPMPREDAAVTQSGILGATRAGGVFPSAQEMQALGTQPATATASGAGSIPTIGDLRARITGGIGSAAPVVAGPAVTASDLTLTPPAPPAPSVNQFGIPTFTGIGRAIGGVVQMTPAGGLQFRNPFARVADIAPPSAAIPAPSFAGPRLTNSFDLPQFQSPVGNIDALINMTRDPRFPALPPQHQQFILDEIGNMAPRAFDLQQSPDYSPPPQFYQ